MATLDRWTHLLQVPLVIRFPKLLLLRHDHSPPLVEGSGEVCIDSPSNFQFVLRGAPSDPTYLREQLREQRQDPYDTFSRCRLYGTDASGIEWALGWTTPKVRQEASEWIFRGNMDGLSPYSCRAADATDSRTELLFAVPSAHPLVGLMHADFAAGLGNEPLEYRKRILDSDVRMRYDLERETLSITATHSEKLPPTYTENWLAEPLRIMFGQLIYPRLVARNLEHGDAHVYLRLAHTLTRDTSWAALIQHPAFLQAGSFWERYAQWLTLIALARNENGHPNFEANRVTRIYEELIQATMGSRWVWALTLASSIESLTMRLGAVGTPRPDFDADAADGLIRHLGSFPGADRLKNIAVNAVGRAGKTSTVDALRALVASNALTQLQYDAWYEIRNSVMHGSLLSPYSTEHEDEKLIALMEMLHSLTMKVLEKSATPSS